MYVVVNISEFLIVPGIGSLYRVHHCHMPARWQRWPGKTDRDKQQMNLLSSSGNANKVCLPPSSWMWRKWSSKLKWKKFCSPPVWTSNSVSDPLFKRENIVGAHHRPSCGFTCGTTERIWGSGMENLLPWRSRYVTCKEKQSQKWVLPGMLLFQSSVGSFPDRIKGLGFFLSWSKNFWF